MVGPVVLVSELGVFDVSRLWSLTTWRAPMPIEMSDRSFKGLREGLASSESQRKRSVDVRNMYTGTDLHLVQAFSQMRIPFLMMQQCRAGIWRCLFANF